MISSPGTGLQGPDGTCGYSVRMAECGPVFELACCVDEAGTLANSSRQFRLDVFLCIREKTDFICFRMLAILIHIFCFVLCIL